MHLVLSGNTGSGKSTLAAELGARLKMPVISSGSIARDLAQNDAATDLALRLGGMAPEQAMRSEIRSRIEAADIQRGGWILDGFPRTLEQLICLLQWSAAMPFFVHLNTSEWVCIERLVNRGRDFDNPDAVAKRMHDYREKTSRMVDVLRAGGVLTEVPGEQASTNAQADHVMAYLQELAT